MTMPIDIGSRQNFTSIPLESKHMASLASCPKEPFSAYSRPTVSTHSKTSHLLLHFQILTEIRHVYVSTQNRDSHFEANADPQAEAGCLLPSKTGTAGHEME